MQSITNALISAQQAGASSVPAISISSTRPLKAVLPPITQYQFDHYQQLNTEEIVRKVSFLFDSSLNFQ
jgi:homeobox protein cut-like